MFYSITSIHCVYHGIFTVLYLVLGHLSLRTRKPKAKEQKPASRHTVRKKAATIDPPAVHLCRALALQGVRQQRYQLTK